MPKLPFYFGQMIVSNGLIAFCPLCRGSFLGTPRTSKSFKLSTFWLLDLASGSRGWLKQKDIFFLGKRIIALSPVVPIKLAPLSTSRPIVSRSCLLIFPATINLFQLLAASLSFCAPWPRDLLAILPSPTHRPTRTLERLCGQKASLRRLLLQPVAPH
jgi:hypothetical protein